jgi:hypothetical protein
MDVREREVPVLWPISLLKNAVVALFNLAKCGAKLRTEAQNNDLRRYFGIASMR